MTTFSVTISVYKNDTPDHFSLAMNSIIEQTFPPNEIVLTIDGPISASLSDIISKYEKELCNLKIIRIPENKGQGIAHQIGVINCSHELIAIMDSDDIAVKDRFEKQIKCFEENPDIDILGGFIAEFIDDRDNIISIRSVPLEDNLIKKYLKRRCPFNQMTVMVRKNSVLNAGNYQDWYFEEDYYLWCRMFLNGCKFKNIPNILVYVRVGKAMYNRRGGWKYFKSEIKLQRFMLDNKIIIQFEYIINVVIRFVVQIIMPNTIRGLFFRYFFRNKYPKDYF
jgi:glycosyltransferase involved in cell wall biosynthesis